MYISQLKTKFRLYFFFPECLEVKEIKNEITLNSFSTEFYFDLWCTQHIQFCLLAFFIKDKYFQLLIIIYYYIKWSALQGFLPLRKTLPPHVKNLQ